MVVPKIALPERNWAGLLQGHEGRNDSERTYPSEKTSMAGVRLPVIPDSFAE